MQFPKFLLRQLAHPQGSLAPITAWLLNRANRAQIRCAITALELAPEHKVLDIGFGGGTSFPMLFGACASGKVAGVERAEAMVTRARRIWSREVEAEHLQIEPGTADTLPWPEAFFDRVMTVNTVYFWQDMEVGLREILRVLAPGGLFVSSVLPAETLDSWGYTNQGFRVEKPSFYAEALRAVGFVEVILQETGDKRKSIVVRGMRA
jgi:arsenite methyltransferase